MSWLNALQLAAWARFRDPLLVANPVLGGMGSYAWIYRCNDTLTGRHAAVKFIQNLPQLQNRFEREIDVLSVVNHLNCVRMILVRREVRCIRIAMEYVDNDLGTYVKVFGAVDPHDLRNFMLQTLQGLAHCHSRGIVHCNITPQNLLLESHTRIIKITGFSHSRYLHHSTPADQITINQYSPPEILLRWPVITAAVDIWCLGCTFAQLLMGYHEFPGIYHLFLPPHLPGGPALQPPPHTVFARAFPGLEVEALDLLTKMLCFRPHQRISIADAMQHDYFRGFRLRL